MFDIAMTVVSVAPCSLFTAVELLAEQSWDLGTNPQVLQKVLLRSLQLDSQASHYGHVDTLASLTASVNR